MTLKAAQFVNLLLTGVLTANEFGSWAALHPALRELPQEAHVRSEQTVTRRYGKMMPALIRELWSLSFRSCPVSLIAGRCLFSSTSGDALLRDDARDNSGRQHTHKSTYTRTRPRYNF